MIKGVNIMNRLKILYIPVIAIMVFASSVLFACGEVPIAATQEEGQEATVFQGVKLTPIADQGNNALAGTQNIDKDSYTLTVDGLVEKPLTITYDALAAYPQEEWLMDLNCVEGWSFTAKWTGPKLSSLFDDAAVKPDAKIAIFYSSDVPTGYTSLDVDYIVENDILLALKLNDLTIPAERGFPFQVVAKSKYGYKWAKWVTRIELSSDTDFRGYWENVGYNNNADDTGPAFEQYSK